MIRRFLYFAISITLCNGKEPSKIANGYRVSITDNMHQVSLHHQNVHVCSGSLISSKHVLTVATCILLEPHVTLGNIRVVAGTTDKLNAYGIAEFSDVSYILFHPNHDPMEFWSNDICILKLESPLVFGTNYREVSLTSRLITSSDILICSGWGDKFIPFWEQTRYLSAVNLKINRRRECEELFGAELFVHQVCAQPIGHNEAITEGDGGNPILYEREIVGMISLYNPRESNLVIFTRILDYIDWIQFAIRRYL